MMSLTFGLFTQVSGSGPLGPLVFESIILKNLWCKIASTKQTVASYLKYPFSLKLLE